MTTRQRRCSAILTSLHIGEEMVVRIPQRRQDFHRAAALLAEADKTNSLGFDEEIADMRTRDAEIR